MRLVMMGTGRFAEPTFEALLESRHEVAGLVTNPDRPSGRDREMVRHIKELAVARGLPVLQPESINTPAGVAALKELRPELLVVAAYGQILSADVLNVAPLGGINVHASLLPKYRGAAPIAWAIYHGETRTGVTIIRMSTRMDAGDMLAQEAIEILPGETAGDLEARLAPLGARLAIQVIEQIEAGTAQGVKQDPSQITKAPKLKKEHGLIDWTRDAEEVCRQIRAMQPWPTPYTFFHRVGQPPLRVLILRTGFKMGIPGGLKALPGTFLLERVGSRDVPYSGRLLVTACPAGGAASWVEVTELQPAGKRVMTAAEFLRGHRVQPGDRFGPEAV